MERAYNGIKILDTVWNMIENASKTEEKLPVSGMDIGDQIEELTKIVLETNKKIQNIVQNIFTISPASKIEGLLKGQKRENQLLEQKLTEVQEKIKNLFFDVLYKDQIKSPHFAKYIGRIDLLMLQVFQLQSYTNCIDAIIEKALFRNLQQLFATASFGNNVDREDLGHEHGLRNNTKGLLDKIQEMKGFNQELFCQLKEDVALLVENFVECDTMNGFTSNNDEEEEIDEENEAIPNFIDIQGRSFLEDQFLTLQSFNASVRLFFGYDEEVLLDTALKNICTASKKIFALYAQYWGDVKGHTPIADGSVTTRKYAATISILKKEIASIKKEIIEERTNIISVKNKLYLKDFRYLLLYVQTVLFDLGILRENLERLPLEEDSFLSGLLYIQKKVFFLLGEHLQHGTQSTGDDFKDTEENPTKNPLDKRYNLINSLCKDCVLPLIELQDNSDTLSIVKTMHSATELVVAFALEVLFQDLPIGNIEKSLYKRDSQKCTLESVALFFLKKIIFFKKKDLENDIGSLLLFSVFMTTETKKFQSIKEQIIKNPSIRPFFEQFQKQCQEYGFIVAKENRKDFEGFFHGIFRQYNSKDQSQKVDAANFSEQLKKQVMSLESESICNDNKQYKTFFTEILTENTSKKSSRKNKRKKTSDTNESLTQTPLNTACGYFSLRNPFTEYIIRWLQNASLDPKFEIYRNYSRDFTGSKPGHLQDQAKSEEITSLVKQFQRLDPFISERVNTERNLQSQKENLGNITAQYNDLKVQCSSNFLASRATTDTIANIQARLENALGYTDLFIVLFEYIKEKTGLNDEKMKEILKIFKTNQYLIVRLVTKFNKYCKLLQSTPAVPARNEVEAIKIIPVNEIYQEAEEHYCEDFLQNVWSFDALRIIRNELNSQDRNSSQPLLRSLCIAFKLNIEKKSAEYSEKHPFYQSISKWKESVFADIKTILKEGIEIDSNFDYQKAFEDYKEKIEQCNGYLTGTITGIQRDIANFDSSKVLFEAEKNLDELQQKLLDTVVLKSKFIGILLKEENGEIARAQGLCKEAIQEIKAWMRLDGLLPNNQEINTKWLSGRRKHPMVEELIRIFESYGITLATKHDGVQPNYQTAKEYLELVVLHDPQAMLAHLYLGMLYEKDNSKKAEKHFIKACRFSKEEAFPFNRYGIFLLHQKRRDAAFKQFEKCIILNPNDAVARSMLGFLLLSETVPENNIEHAGRHLKRAYTVAPNNYIVLKYFGFYQLRTGQYAQAERYFQKALRIEQDDQDLSEYFARSLFYQDKQLMKAEEVLRDIIGKSTNNSIVIKLLAQILRREHTVLLHAVRLIMLEVEPLQHMATKEDVYRKIEDIIKGFRNNEAFQYIAKLSSSAYDHVQGNGEAFWRHIKNSLEKKLQEKIQDAYQYFLQLYNHTEDLQAASELGQILQEAPLGIIRNDETAEKYLTVVVESNSNDTESLARLGALYFRKGDIEKAKKHLKDVLKKDQGCEYAKIYLSGLRILYSQDQKKKKEAKNVIAQLIKSGVLDSFLYAVEGVRLLVNEEGRKGLGFLKKALIFNPSEPVALQYLGVHYFNQSNISLELLGRAKELDRAKKYFNKLLKQDKNNLEAHFYLGRIYHMQHQEDVAKKHIQEAYNLNSEDPNIKKWYAMMHLEMDDAYEILESIEEKDKEVLFALGAISLKNNNNEQAMKWFMEVLKVDHYHVLAYIELGGISEGEQQTHYFNQALRVATDQKQVKALIRQKKLQMNVVYVVPPTEVTAKTSEDSLSEEDSS